MRHKFVLLKFEVIYTDFKLLLTNLDELFPHPWLGVAIFPWMPISSVDFRKYLWTLGAFLRYGRKKFFSTSGGELIPVDR